MAEAFVNQLLRVENRVQRSDQCIICLTECESLCPKTGIVEYEIRLPCNHTVGSRCIAKWLDPAGVASNSCPMCRYVFFPAQPRPYLELGIMVDGDDVNPADVVAEDLYDHSEVLDFSAFSPFTTGSGNDNEEEEEEEEEERDMQLYHDTEIAIMKDMCSTYCHRLDLASRPTVIFVSQHLAKKMYMYCKSFYYGLSNMAAFSVFVASHLLGVPRSQHWVCAMAGAEDDDVSYLYRLFRFSLIGADLIDEEILAVIDRGDLETVVRYLPRVPDE